jgi:hypothetical protein
MTGDIYDKATFGTAPQRRARDRLERKRSGEIPSQFKICFKQDCFGPTGSRDARFSRAANVLTFLV